MKISAALLAFAGLTSLVSAADCTVALGATEFPTFLEENSLVWTEFYAPWCGHCKKLLPEAEKACKKLDGVRITKVDCTEDENKDLCSKHGVSGYPTIKVFRNGEVSDYEGGRTADAIVDYLEDAQRPAVSELEDAEAHTAFQSVKNVVVVGYFTEKEESFDAIGEALRGSAAVGRVVGDELYGAENGQIVLYRSFDEPRIVYDGEMNAEDLASFVAENALPLVGPIGPDNYKDYVERGVPLIWIVVDFDSDATAALEESARAVAADYKGQMSFVLLDGAKFEGHAKNMGLSGKWPGIVVDAQPKKYVFPEETEITQDSLAEFIKNFADGKLTPNLKSEEIPTPNDESVFVLVGKNFDDEVLNNDKHVLVEFYAPWCGHCKKLAPIWDQVGEAFAHADNVVVAKMDSTANDSPIEVQGFPTIYFFPGDDKAVENAVEYRGGRDYDALVDFLKENTKVEPAAGSGDETKEEL
jgi:protein disulfide-isomerase A1